MKIITEKKIICDEITIVNLVKESVNSRKNILLTYFNQHSFNIYNSNITYKKLLEEKFSVYSDGIGMHFALKCFGYDKQCKGLNATDLNEKIIDYMISEKKSIFIIGGNFSENDIIEKTKNKNIVLAGYKNGYFNDDEINNIITKIRNSTCEIIILGLGIPKQEFFASALEKEFPHTAIICVGNFLEFYFGYIKRASKKYRALGLEWFFRTLTEPKRLWKRYLIGIPQFLITVFYFKIKQVFNIR